MTAVALLIPPLLLGLVVLLDRYEEYMRATSAPRPPRGVPPVPPLPLATGARTAGGTGQAAGGDVR
ncbi:hypothetical protein [Streptomyces sp. NPDC005805]|uniref:hypothetical protein n=1 Tax=Streptomyces sp. NPDC005805 TaxID=3157068 RepID=UPI0033F4127C